jgi:hypothetical protein
MSLGTMPRSLFILIIVGHELGWIGRVAASMFALLVVSTMV